MTRVRKSRIWFERAVRRRDTASADTLPKGQDAKQGLAGTESGAVGEAETPKVQS